MMRMRNLVNGLVVTGVVLAMVSSLAAQTVVQTSAKVVRVKGSARYKTDSNGWQPLTHGTVLKAGALVETAGEGSYVDLALGEGARPQLRPAAARASRPGAGPADFLRSASAGSQQQHRQGIFSGA